jgi:ribosome biogenesis GTPase
LIDDEEGVDVTFSDIVALAEHCRFRDCRHQGEPGCAVESAVDTGELDRARLESYRKLRREIDVIEWRSDPAHSERPKRRWKSVSKAIKNWKKTKRDLG